MDYHLPDQLASTHLDPPTSASARLPPEILHLILLFTQNEGDRDSLTQQRVRFRFEAVSRSWFHTARAIPKHYAVDGLLMALRLAQNLEGRAEPPVIRGLTFSAPIVPDAEHKDNLAILLELCEYVEFMDLNVQLGDEDQIAWHLAPIYGQRFEAAWSRLTSIQFLRISLRSTGEGDNEIIRQLCTSPPGLKKLHINFQGVPSLDSNTPAPSTFTSLTSLDFSLPATSGPVLFSDYFPLAAYFLTSAKPTLKSLSLPLMNESPGENMMAALSAVAPNLTRFSVHLADVVPEEMVTCIRSMRSLEYLNLKIVCETWDIEALIERLQNLRQLVLHVHNLTCPDVLRLLTAVPTSLRYLYLFTWEVRLREERKEVVEFGRSRGVEVGFLKFSQRAWRDEKKRVVEWQGFPRILGCY